MVNGDVEKRLWAAADQLWANTGLKPSQFSMPVLGLIFLRYAEKRFAEAEQRIGPVGSGQLAKMVNQICIAGVVQGLAEGLHFARCAGLDPAIVIESISQGAAQSWQMENRWETMIRNEFEFGFAVEWMRKDLKIALEEAERNGARLDMTRLVDGYYAEVQELGGNRWDTSSLIARLES